MVSYPASGLPSSAVLSINSNVLPSLSAVPPSAVLPAAASSAINVGSRPSKMACWIASTDASPSSSTASSTG